MQVQKFCSGILVKFWAIIKIKIWFKKLYLVLVIIYYIFYGIIPENTAWIKNKNIMNAIPNLKLINEKKVY